MGIHTFEDSKREEQREKMTKQSQGQKKIQTDMRKRYLKKGRDRELCLHTQVLDTSY